MSEQDLSFKCCQSFEQFGQDLSKEVLWVSVGQRAAKLQALKVTGLKKSSTARPESNHIRTVRKDHTQKPTDCKQAVHRPAETESSTLERS